jgi:HD-like signal output (HDOD) protein
MPTSQWFGYAIVMAPKYSIDELVFIAEKISPFPAAAKKAIDILRDPEPDFALLTEVVSKDQVLAGMMLRWANSASFGIAHTVSSVRQALMILGLVSVKTVILMNGFSGQYLQAVDRYGFSKGELWRHSVGMASGANLLAKPFGRRMADEAYNAGLLCDIGLLPMDVLFAQMEITIPEHTSVREIEIEFFGIDHAQLGAEIAKTWQFPHSIQDAIQYQNQPGECPDDQHRMLAAANHLASHVLSQQGLGSKMNDQLIDPRALQLYHLSENELGQLYARIEPILDESEILIGLNI